MKTFIYTTHIGYTMHQAETATEAWAEAITEEVPLDCYYAIDKEQLRNKLIADGFKTATTCPDYAHLHEVTKEEANDDK